VLWQRNRTHAAPQGSWEVLPEVTGSQRAAVTMSTERSILSRPLPRSVNTNNEQLPCHTEELACGPTCLWQRRSFNWLASHHWKPGETWASHIWINVISKQNSLSVSRIFNSSLGQIGLLTFCYCCYQRNLSKEDVTAHVAALSLESLNLFFKGLIHSDWFDVCQCVGPSTSPFSACII
jgi:hypothetical protein